MGRYKFLVSGPVGAGKTAAIDAVTETERFNTDVNVSDTAGLRKESTTVAMDYGTVAMSNGKKAHIYGTPGQERFDFMWEVLSKGTEGLLLLFDNSRNHPQRDLLHYLRAFSSLIVKVPLVIGVTRMDIKARPALDDYRGWLAAIKIDAPVVKVDARERVDVLNALEILSEKVEASTGYQAKANENNTHTAGNQTAVATAPKQIAAEVPTPTPQLIGDLHSSHTRALVDSTAETGSLFNDEVIERIQELRGVTGIMLSDDMGEILHSSIEDEEVTDFSAFLASVTPIIEESLGMGCINRVTLKSPKDDNLNFFIEAEQSLTIASNRRVSIPVLTQQIEDVLQWG
jgi:signal recognition particle receptor subunit beta